jgi:hypothetical protein
VSYSWGSICMGAVDRSASSPAARPRGVSPRHVALSRPDVTTAYVEDWVREAQADAQAG